MTTLIISGSARKKGNTKLVLDQLHIANSETIHLVEQNIAHFNYSRATEDDFQIIAEKTSGKTK